MKALIKKWWGQIKHRISVWWDTLEKIPNRVSMKALIKKWWGQIKHRFSAWWNALEKIPKRFFITIVTVGIAIMAYQMWIYMNQFGGANSAIFYGLMKATTGASYLRVLDDFLYTRIDTEKLLSENAIAYAIYIFAYAYVIGGAFGV